jgi:Arylsulfotransferase (ASST)
MQMLGYGRGHGVIMDSKYRIVNSVQAGGGMAGSDMHEFNVINGGETALMTIYQPRQYDMSPWNLKKGMGWIMDCIFQEVNVTTSEVLWEWHSVDHVSPHVSYVGPAETEVSGDGFSKETAWDYFHINSIDKNADGDYLISSRHTSCLYKINGTDGEIIWRLQGADSTFKLTNFNFSMQHDARWISDNTTHTILSLFDNASDGFSETATDSTGMIISIDHTLKTATLTHDRAAYTAPRSQMPDGLVSTSQGNMQILPNTNIFTGWGNWAFVSEHTADGTPIFWARFATTGKMNYRAFRANWTGHPTDAPALWAYSQNATAPTATYVSWNGATEVRSWNFYAGPSRQGPWTRFANGVTKTGFETVYSHSGFAGAFIMAEALDSRRRGMRNSTVTENFVPGADLAVSCGPLLCEAVGFYGDAPPPPPPPPPPEVHEEPVEEVEEVKEEVEEEEMAHEESHDPLWLEGEGKSWIFWPWLVVIVLITIAVAVLR